MCLGEGVDDTVDQSQAERPRGGKMIGDISFQLRKIPDIWLSTDRL